MRNIKKLLYIASIWLTASGCGGDSNSHSRQAIAVSFEPMAWIAQEIAGDDIEIITMLPAGSDPEMYQPSISTMKRLENAKAYITLGTEGFEQTLSQTLPKNFPKLQIIDASEGIEKITDSHSTATGSDGHKHADSFDPHLLVSIKNSKKIAQNIAETLATLYPEKAAKYRESGESLTARLQELDDTIARKNIKGKSVVIRHPSLSYYSRDYGVVQISLNEIGKETSAKQLKTRLDDSAQARPAIMIIEKEHATASDNSIARQLRVDTIIVSLNSANWLNDIKRITDEIDRD